MIKHELLVLGTGVAGYTAASICADAGMDVAIADNREYGGTCALRGCVPKKVLFEGTYIVQRANDMMGKGPKGDIEVDWVDLMEFKRTFTEEFPDKRERDLEDKDIIRYHGRARFTGPNTTRIGDRKVGFDKVLIATGAVPRKLSIKGEEYISTSEEVLEMDQLPKTVLFIGGGYISFELASILMRAGTNIFIVNRSSAPLKRFDEKMVESLVRDMRKRGARILMNTEPERVKKCNNYLQTVCKDNKGGSIRIDSDIVVHGAGRVPSIKELDLEKADILVDEKGIKVDDYLRSITNSSVFVAGDSNGRDIPLKKSAEMQGVVAAENIQNEKTRELDLSVVPSTVFSQVPLSSVGSTKNDLMKEDREFEEISGDMGRWNQRRMISDPLSSYRIFIENETGRILGAHLLGHGSQELINIFALCMKFGISKDDLRAMIWNFPTLGSDIHIMLDRSP